MTFISQTDRENIAEAIRQVEKNTDGELVTVISRQSDQYFYIPLLWATLIALAIPGLIMIVDHPLALMHSYTIQFVSFLVLAILFRWQPVTMRLIPRQVKHQRAHRVAMEQFFMQNLHHTKSASGILIFVSIAERYVEIIADKGINDVVPAGSWDAIVEQFTSRVKGGQVATGFLETIDACGHVLAEHYPKSDGNPNELPNHLVEI